jgi:hypothetical protein
MAREIALRMKCGIYVLGKIEVLNEAGGARTTSPLMSDEHQGNRTKGEAN